MSIEPFQWVEAQLLGIWLTCWYRGMTDGGMYIVQFSDDAPDRFVKQIRQRRS